MNWKKLNTLSHQIREGQPVSSSFSWCKDEEENIHIKSNKTKIIFSPYDYSAMLSHVNKHYGVPLGSRRDGTVPGDSLGALMEKRYKSSSIRGWCSHLAAIAVHEGDINYEDKGRGAGKGIWLFPKKTNT
jgi:hypothetical protein